MKEPPKPFPGWCIPYLKKCDRMPEYEQIATKAKHYCAYQERCINDVRKKLAQWQASKQQSEKIIEELVEEKYLDEERFATIFVTSKLRNNQWGKRKIEFELKKRGIPEGTITKTINSINAEEYSALLRHLLTKKATEYGSIDPFEKKQKLIRFAIGKGFSADDIYAAL
jgi:regulatory protein